MQAYSATERLGEHPRKFQAGSNEGTMPAVITYQAYDYNAIGYVDRKGQVVSLAPKGQWESSSYWVVGTDDGNFHRVVGEHGKFIERS